MKHPLAGSGGVQCRRSFILQFLFPVMTTIFNVWHISEIGSFLLFLQGPFTAKQDLQFRAREEAPPQIRKSEELHQARHHSSRSPFVQGWTSSPPEWSLSSKTKSITRGVARLTPFKFPPLSLSLSYVQIYIYIYVDLDPRANEDGALAFLGINGP